MGCAVETPKPKRRRKGLSAPRPYCELSEEAKARARDCWREQGWTWNEWDSDQLTEFFKQELECAYGIDDAKVEWDLGYSQGDHVTFKASPRIERMAERSAELAQLLKAAEVLTAASGGDDVEWDSVIDEHRAYVAFRTMPEDGDMARLLDQLADAMETVACRAWRDACQHLKKLGYQEIEYHDSDEYVDDELTANDQYLFTAEGEFDS